MQKYKTEQACLIYLVDAGISKRGPAGSINNTDYAAIYTPSINNPMPLGVRCLIWLHSEVGPKRSTTISDAWWSKITKPVD